MNNNFKAAITSIGFNSVFGSGEDAFFKFLKEPPIKSEITNLDPEGYLGTKGIRYLNKATKLYCNLAFQCINNRLLNSKIESESDKIGLYDGSDLSNIQDGFVFDLTAKIDGPNLVSPMSAPNTIANASSSMMAIKSSIKGPNFTVCGGSCGSLQALDVAILHLSEKIVDCAIIGSTEITSRYHKAVRQGELRGDVGDATEMGIAFSIDPLIEAKKEGLKIFGIVSGLQSGQKLKNETSENLIVRLIIQLLKNTDKIIEQIDSIILSGGNHLIKKEQLKILIIKELKTNKDLPIIYTESIYGVGDNAGGFVGMLLAIGLFNHKNKTDLIEMQIDGVLPEKVSNSIVITLDVTGYSVITLFEKP